MIAYYNWLTEDEIDSCNVFDPEIYQCKSDVLLLNQDQEIYIPVPCDVEKRLWYYNKADDTSAKRKAIQALQYMLANWLWIQEQQMAVQPKVDQWIYAMDTQNKDLNVNGLWSI